MKVDILAKRVVLDTNIWLGAALVIQRVLSCGVPVFSDSTFAELETRIWKPKFDRYLSIEARQGILHDARALGHWVDIPAAIAGLRWRRDADDDKFIHTALAGSAMWLVTGDQDLLTINAALNVRTVSPARPC